MKQNRRYISSVISSASKSCKGFLWHAVKGVIESVNLKYENSNLNFLTLILPNITQILNPLHLLDC